MNRRSQMLEALDVSTKWTLRGATPAGLEAVEVATTESVAVEVEVDSFVTAESMPVRGGPPVMHALSDTAVSHAQRIAAFNWAQLEAAVSNCTSYKLCERHTNTVSGVGNRETGWMLISETPGEQKDKQDEPFAGQADRLLDSVLQSVGLSRERGTFIANVLKCRPPGSRNPEPGEAAMCDPYLKRQVALVRLRIIVMLGRIAAQNLLQTRTPAGKLRGKVHGVEGVPVVVTYHPVYLLHTLTGKARTWEDLCLARKIYAERDGQQSAACLPAGRLHVSGAYLRQWARRYGTVSR